MTRRNTKMLIPWEDASPNTLTKLETRHEWYIGKTTGDLERFLLRYDNKTTPELNLPLLSGLNIYVHKESDLVSYLIFELEKQPDLDIFNQLFTAIIEGTERAEGSAQAVTSTIQQLSNWQKMLKRKYSYKLSVEEQKGLIGELYVLKSVLIPNIASFTEGLACWTGPSGSPKDFNIGNIGIEVKARSGVSEPYINISSSHQLDDSNVHSLYLCVVTLNEATSEVPESFTLMDKINEMLKFYETEPTAHARFIDLLNAYPHDQNQLDLEDKYEDRFVFGGVEYYNVLNGFPRIVGSEIHQAVIDVRYRIPLNSCSDFIVPETDITTYLN